LHCFWPFDFYFNLLILPKFLSYLLKAFHKFCLSHIFIGTECIYTFICLLNLGVIQVKISIIWSDVSILSRLIYIIVELFHKFLFWTSNSVWALSAKLNERFWHLLSTCILILVVDLGNMAMLSSYEPRIIVILFNQISYFYRFHHHLWVFLLNSVYKLFWNL